MNFLSSGRRNPDITVDLPEHEYKDINIEDVSGDVEGTYTFGMPYEVETVSGTVDLKIRI